MMILKGIRMVQINNLNNYSPKKGERYFVDTNVWYWITYVASKEMKVVDVPQSYQMTDYPGFIEKALTNGAQLYHCALTLAELAATIENAELKLYQLTKQHVTKKVYRAIPAERKGVVNEIDVAWNAISSLSTCVDITLTEQSAEASINILAKSKLDSYDSFYAQLMETQKITNIITDDGDFSSLDGSAVYTANKRLVG